MIVRYLKSQFETKAKIQKKLSDVQLVQKLKNPKNKELFENNGWYEVINAKINHECDFENIYVHPYFDIDCPINDLTELEKKKQEKKVITDALVYLYDIFELEITYNDKGYLVRDFKSHFAVSASTYPNKISFHVIIHTKEVPYIWLCNWIKINKESLQKLFIDTDPYHSYQTFRLIGTSKQGKKAPLIPYEFEGYTNTNYLQHLITNTKQTTLLPQDVNTVIELQNQKQKIIDNVIFCDYEINDELLRKMLFTIKNNELTDTEWLKITTALKSCGKQQLWDEWNQTNKEKYNEKGNISRWDSADINFTNVNTIVSICNEKYNTKYEYFVPKIEQLTNDHGYKCKEVCNPFLYYKPEQKPASVISQYEYEDFKNNDAIVIQARTGQGKTSSNIDHFLTYTKETGNENKKIISIVSKRTLGQQHLSDFKKGGLDCSYYTSNKFDYKQNIVICINSLLKLSELTDEEISNRVVFIDEINLFISELTHNSTLKDNLKHIFILLKRIVNNCHKIVVFQNEITDNVFEFLSNIKHEKKLFLKNTYIDSVKKIANEYKDENMFIEQVKKEITNNSKGFLFACDSRKVVVDIYQICVKIATEEQKKRFILVTSKEEYELLDAKTQFLEMYVFYSPSIIYGIDASFPHKQNQYIYITGKSINVQSLFQQAMRTRNLEQLHFYSDDVRSQKQTYKSLEDTKRHFKSLSNMCSELYNMTVVLDELDEYQVVENNFFNLYCWNEYINDLYDSNKLYHFRKLLTDNGFDIINKSDGSGHIDPTIIDEIRNNLSDIENEIFEDFLQDLGNDKTLLEQSKYDSINSNISFLKLPLDVEVIENYKNYVINDKKAIKSHLDVIKFMTDDLTINYKLQSLNNNSFGVTKFNNIYFKIKLLRTFEKENNIKPFDLSGKNIQVNVSDNLYNLIVKCFQTKKLKPKDEKEVLQMYIFMIKYLIGINYVTTTRKFERTVYSFNTDLLKQNIDLYQYMLPNLSTIHNTIKNLLGIPLTVVKENVVFDSSFLDI